MLLASDTTCNLTDTVSSSSLNNKQDAAPELRGDPFHKQGLGEVQ